MGTHDRVDTTPINSVRAFADERHSDNVVVVCPKAHTVQRDLHDTCAATDHQADMPVRVQVRTSRSEVLGLRATYGVEHRTVGRTGACTDALAEYECDTSMDNEVTWIRRISNMQVHNTLIMSSR